MNKINTFIDKNIIKIMMILLLIGPVIDCFTSLQIHYSSMSFSIGMIFKILFLLFLCYYHVFINGFKNKTIVIYLFLIFIYIFLSLFIVNSFSMNNASGLFRMMFFPLSLMLSYFIFKDKKETIGLKTIRMVAIIYGILIIIPVLTNTAFDSYAVAKKGSLGWFNSANEISAILAIILPFIFYNAFNKFKIYKLIPLLIIIIAIFIIGTKTPLFSLLVCTVAFFLKLIITYFKRKNYTILTIIGGVVITFIISSILIIPKTNIYKNTIIHLDYLKIEKVSDLFDYEKIDHFIFGSRIKFLKQNHDGYVKANVSEKMFGMAFNDDKLVEMDMFDVLYRTGVVGLILFLLPLIIAIVDSKKFDKKYWISACMIMFSSFLAGHVLTAPSVSIIVVMIISEGFLKKSIKKKVVITAYDLNYGGIETSLITLLKNINYNKMNVTLYLEKKQGVFLDAIPNEVKIKEYRPFNNKNMIVRKLLNLIKKIKFMVFESNSYDSSITYATYSLPGVFIGLNASNNQVMFVHSNYRYVYKENETDIRKFFDERKIEEFDHVVFVSNESRNDLIKYYPALKETSLTINNLVDYKRINQLSLEKIDIKKKRTTFLFVGRLEEASKKISRIIDVAKKFENDERAEFWIIGDGEDKKLYVDKIRKQKLKNIIMLGAKKNPYPYMKMCDYVILTSDYEGFPVTYSEAMVLNKPIISTISVSDDTVCVPGEFGILVKKDVNDIYENILKVLDNGFQVKKTVDFEKINRNRIKMIESILEVNDEKI